MNYFDILEYQGVGMGMPQQRPNARHIDPNRPVAPPPRKLPRPNVPHAYQLVPEMHESFLLLAYEVVLHSTYLQGTYQEGPSEPPYMGGVEPPPLNGVDPPPPSGVEPSPSSDRGASSSGTRPAHDEHSREPHPCTLL